MLIQSRRKFVLKITPLIKLFFPNKKNEWIIFSLFFLIYISYSLPIALNTEFLDFGGKLNGKYLADLYSSFDNLRYFHDGRGGLLPHPLILLITKPILWIGSILILIFQTIKAKTVFVLLVTVCTMSMSTTIVNRYLTTIIELKKGISLLITLIYGFFSTCLLLAFTFESFIFSLCFLSIMVFYYSSIMKNGKNSSLLADLFFSIGAGGITITNFAKGIICIYFEKNSFKRKVFKIALISISFTILVLIAYTIFENGISQAYRLHKAYDTFSSYSKETGIIGYTTRIIDTFFIAPILSYDFITVKHPFDSLLRIIHDIDENYNFSRLFQFSWRSLFTLVFYTLIFLSLILNHKRKLVILLIAIWGVDIFIHLIMKFGIYDGYFIYGGHWVYVFPLLLGWLYKAFKYKKALQYIYISIFSVLVINNISTLLNFVKLVFTNFSFS